MKIAHTHEDILQLVHRELDLIELAILRPHSNQEQVCTCAEVLSINADHHAFVIPFDEVQTLGDHLEHIRIEGIHLGVELDPYHSIPKIKDRGTRIFLEDFSRSFQPGQHDHRGGTFDLDIPSERGIENTNFYFTVILVKSLVPGRQHLLDPGSRRETRRSHRFCRLGCTETVPGFERPCFSIEAPAHGIVNSFWCIGDFRDAIGRVSQALVGQRPYQLPGAVFGRYQQLDALTYIFDVFNFSDRLEAHFLGRMVLQCLQVERPEFFSAVVGAHFFIETLFRFIPQSAARNQRFNQRVYFLGA